MTIPAIPVRPLGRIAPEAIDALLDRAFGSDRHGRTAYRLRAGTTAIAALSFAVVEGERLVGSLQCWPLSLVGDDGAVTPMVLVGPVAVDPDRQDMGIGRAMMAALLAAARTEPHADVLAMVGDPAYYARWDFTAADTVGWRLPCPWEPHRLLARRSALRGAELAGMLAPGWPNP